MHLQVCAVRDEELHHLRVAEYLVSVVGFLMGLVPPLTTVFGLGLYAMMGHPLTPARAFTSILLFNILQQPISMIPMVVQYLGEVSNSFGRLDRFLGAQERQLTVCTGQNGSWKWLVSEPAVGDQIAVQVVGPASFRWREGRAPKEEELQKKKKKLKTLEAAAVDDKKQAIKEQLQAEVLMLEQLIDSCGSSALVPIRGQPSLHTDLSLKIPPGSLVLVVGPVGSGKSTLLAALLNEVYREQGDITIRGPVSYAPQESFIIHETVRNNILFTKPYNAARYSNVLKACALEEDLRNFAGGQGDMTEIGEKGANLSGGQRARIGLARAMYAEADIYMMDDVLSAVDPSVATHLMDQCLFGLLKDKTRILVTHHPRWLSQANLIIYIENGKIVHRGKYEEFAPLGIQLAASEPATAATTAATAEAASAEAAAAEAASAEGGGAAAAVQELTEIVLTPMSPGGSRKEEAEQVCERLCVNGCV